MTVSNDNNYKPALEIGASASEKVSVEETGKTAFTPIVDTKEDDHQTAASVQIPNADQPFVRPSKKAKVALPNNTLTHTGLVMGALKNDAETKAEETSGNIFFNISGDQVALQLALQEFIKMNKDVRTINALLSVRDREQQVEAREELKENIIDRGEVLKDQYNKQGNWEIAGAWASAGTSLIGLGLSKAAASYKVNKASAQVPGGLAPDLRVKMMSEYESSFSTVSQQLGSGINSLFTSQDKYIQAEASVAVAALDAQKTLLEDRKEAIKAAKDLSESAVNNASIDEFRRAIEKAQESLAVKPFQG